MALITILWIISLEGIIKNIGGGYVLSKEDCCLLESFLGTLYLFKIGDEFSTLSLYADFLEASIVPSSNTISVL